jgi:hypothetical protein
MHHKRTIVALGTACALAVTPVVAVAAETAAAPPAKTAKPLGNVKRTGKKTATLKVKYSCKTGSVLWISLKQAKDGKKDKALKGEGSSKAAAAWLQSHANPITCDGKSHTKVFKVDEKEQGKGKLVKGQAWLQFCVTQGDALTVSVAKWVTVK